MKTTLTDRELQLITAALRAKINTHADKIDRENKRVRPRRVELDLNGLLLAEYQQLAEKLETEAAA